MTCFLCHSEQNENKYENDKNCRSKSQLTQCIQKKTQKINTNVSGTQRAYSWVYKILPSLLIIMHTQVVN